MQRHLCSGSHSAYTPYNVVSTSISCCSTSACINFARKVTTRITGLLQPSIYPRIPQHFLGTRRLLPPLILISFHALQHLNC